MHLYLFVYDVLCVHGLHLHAPLLVRVRCVVRSWVTSPRTFTCSCTMCCAFMGYISTHLYLFVYDVLSVHGLHLHAPLLVRVRCAVRSWVTHPCTSTCSCTMCCAFMGYTSMHLYLFVYDVLCFHGLHLHAPLLVRVRCAVRSWVTSPRTSTCSCTMCCAFMGYISTHLYLFVYDVLCVHGLHLHAPLLVRVRCVVRSWVTSPCTSTCSCTMCCAFMGYISTHLYLFVYDVLCVHGLHLHAPLLVCVYDVCCAFMGYISIHLYLFVYDVLCVHGLHLHAPLLVRVRCVVRSWVTSPCNFTCSCTMCCAFMGNISIHLYLFVYDVLCVHGLHLHTPLLVRVRCAVRSCVIAPVVIGQRSLIK